MAKLFQSLILFWILILVSCTGYNVEKDGVYYKRFDEARGSNKGLIKDADRESFTILEYEYGKDNQHVFYQGKIIPGADPSSFVPLTRLYATDKFRAYYAGDSIEFSTSEDFTIIDEYYSKDKADIFYTTHSLDVCSVDNFYIYPNKIEEDITDRWSTDGCFYYFKNFQIPSTDYKSIKFFIGSAGFAKDKRWVYYLDRKINYNEKGERIIDTVDVETFTVTNHLDCRDKFGCINVFHGRKNCE
jgi:hypothetical protein